LYLLVMEQLKNVYEFFAVGGDPRTDHWLLVHEPLYILGCILAYLFIVVKGPQWMAKREPFELRKALIVYNFLSSLCLDGCCMNLWQQQFSTLHSTSGVSQSILKTPATCR